MPADPPPPAGIGQDARIIALIGTGHFLSHFYMLSLPPLFLFWQAEFDVSFAELGLAVALMSGTTALLQTPVGFWVDRHGARAFLVGGTLLMALSVSAMAVAPGIWAIWLLAILSGVGNSVIHPADYAILAGSIDKTRMGRAFALHTFTGNLGFALAPPVVALLAATMGWRFALLFVGLLGLPVVAAILVQSRILRDQPKARKADGGPSGREILLSRPILLFFAFFLLSSMAGSGIQAFVITVLGKLWGTPVAVASHGADRLPGRRHLRHAGRRLGGGHVEAQPDRLRRGADGLRHGDDPRPRPAADAGIPAADRGLPGRPGHGHVAHAARRDAEGRRAARARSARCSASSPPACRWAARSRRCRSAS